MCGVIRLAPCSFETLASLTFLCSQIPQSDKRYCRDGLLQRFVGLSCDEPWASSPVDLPDSRPLKPVSQGEFPDHTEYLAPRSFMGVPERFVSYGPTPAV